MNQKISYIKKKKRLRLLASVLFLTLTLTALSACSGGGTDTGGGDSGSDGAGGTSGNTSGKGRYIEEDMDVPLEDGEKILNLTQTKDGAPVLFTSVNNSQVNRYEYNGNDWSKTALDWIGQVYPDQSVIPVEVQETAEGIQYVRGMEQEQSRIARGGNGQRWDTPS